ncbi:protein sip-5 [Luteimonas aquatica]|uniref:protein sip-5 n=1 Tax=Luteimonas aquatica TaxID=450364 RepID=UPI001F5A4B27|nr:protein sip-5 [Luteimonas aquatica]
MKFETLKQRVIRSERLVEGRLEQTQAHATSLKTTWRESWTPTRILIAGLAAGFLVGRARPARAFRRLGGLNGARWIQLIGTLSGLFASLQSTLAAATAKSAAGQAADAAQTADTAAATADEVARDTQAEGGDAGEAQAATPETPSPADRRRRPDPTWSAPPRPAEAATEISER